MASVAVSASSMRWLSSPSSVQPVRCPVTLGSSSGVQRSSRPVSSPSALRSPWFVVRGPAVRPSAVHPSSVLPSGVHPIRPDASVWSHGRRWRWGPGRCGGQPAPRERVEVLVGFRVVERLGRGPSRPESERRCRGHALSGGSVADPGRVGCGRRPRLPAARPARPDRRAERPSLAAARGTGAGCTAQLPDRLRGCRPRAGWATTVRGSRGA
jgi:hypothetical protein